MWNLLFISDDIQNVQKLVKSTNKDTTVFIYKHGSTIGDITKMFRRSMKRQEIEVDSIDHIGWIFHGEKKKMLTICSDLMFYLDKNYIKNMMKNYGLN